VLGPPKTSKSRRVMYLDPESIEVLRWQRERVNIRRTTAGADWTELDLVISSERGTPWSQRRFRSHWEKLLEDLKPSGVTRIRPYDLRSTWASVAMTKLEARGVTSKTVSDRLGHTNIGFTLKTYVRPDLKEQQSLAMTPDELYGTNKPAESETPPVNPNNLN
jgi:integrase